MKWINASYVLMVIWIMIQWSRGEGMKMNEEEEGKKEWIEAGNLAKYLQLEEMNGISLKVEMNVIFIGFNGDGQSKLNLNEKFLSNWFSHIQHKKLHSVIPFQSFHSSFDSSSSSSSYYDQKEGERIEKKGNGMEYELSIRVLQLSPLVNTLLEDHLYWNIRPEDLQGKTEGLDKPEEEVKPKHYINANRFSSLLFSLLNHLNETNRFTLFILNPKSPVQSHEMYGYRNGFSDDELSELFKNDEFKSKDVENLLSGASRDVFPTDAPKKEISKERVINWVKQSNEWAKWFLSKERKKIVETEQCIDNGDLDTCSFLLPLNKSIIEVAKWISKKGTIKEKEYIFEAQNDPHLHEECLVDSWVTQHRFAFIDLTAGPIDFGPSITKQGYRSPQSIPYLPVISVKKAPQNHTHKSEGGIESSSLSQSRYELYQSEKYLLDSFWNQFCEHSKQRDDAFCKDLNEQISFLNLNKTISNEKWDSLLVGDAHEGENEFSAEENFSSQLGHIVSSSIDQLLLPPTSSLRHDFKSRLQFQIYVIKNHDSFNPIAHPYFHYEDFKLQLSKLKFPNQEFSFMVKEISLSSDAKLSLALRTSMKSSIDPKLSSDGNYLSETKLYIDSKEIQHQLEELEDSSQPIESTFQKIIPIFLLSFNYEYPILIDKQYQAKTLDNMVLIVQSNFHSYESQVTCNGKPIFWDLRNPLKAALGAVSTYFGGLLPVHLKWDEAAKSLSQDWMWSIGENPFSQTSLRYSFSTLQKDIILRNYILAAFNDSIYQVNQVVRELTHIQCGEQNQHLIEMIPIESILETMSEVEQLWLTLKDYTQLESLQIYKTIDLLTQNVESLKHMGKLSLDVSQLYQCVHSDNKSNSELQKRTYVNWLLAPSLVINAFIILFWFYFSKRKSQKTKVN
eukprot:TRINITY_DN5306_c0_g1_i1.p1 TRINITY_DN5306_c0_g1~~TRINITY_DN5306_c0_g1_i1.p1  ORF type:complete len:903 (+),score=257.42 TRINITY_DN5306_c0_g1_i1:38-2746(+)